MKKMHVKRGDTVKVIAGKDKGKEGKIITAIPADGKVFVEGVGGKAARTGVKVLDDGSKMRYCKKCNAELND